MFYSYCTYDPYYVHDRIYSCIVTSAIDYLFLDMGTLWVDYCSVATFQDFWGSVYDSGEDCHCMVFGSCATATCSSCGPAATLRTLGYPVRTSMSPERYPSKRLIWDGPRAKVALWPRWKGVINSLGSILSSQSKYILSSYPILISGMKV